MDPTTLTAPRITASQLNVGDTVYVIVKLRPWNHFRDDRFTVKAVVEAKTGSEVTFRYDWDGRSPSVTLNLRKHEDADRVSFSITEKETKRTHDAAVQTTVHKLLGSLSRLRDLESYKAQKLSENMECAIPLLQEALRLMTPEETP
jgi:hypothetical protein